MDIQAVEQKIGNAFGQVSDAQWQYQTLFGKAMPDSPTALMAEAAQQRMPFDQYVAKKYDYSGRKAAMAADETKKREDAIRKEVADQKDREFAERTGNNPNVRTPRDSQYSTISSAVQQGQRKDPLTMSREERHVATRQQIHKEVAENAVA